MPTPQEIARMRVVYRLPGMDRVGVRRDLAYKRLADAPLEMDVYSPPGAGRDSRLPAVVLVHGGPIPPNARAKDWGVFVSYGELLAASGLVAVTFNHRFHDASLLGGAADDVVAALDYIRGHADELGIDKDRLALWAFSGGGPLLSESLRARPLFVRALVAFYAALDLQVPPSGPDSGISDDTRRQFSPLHHLAAGTGLVAPMLVARAGRDHPWLNASVDRFVLEALARNASLELLTHPEGQHGFDILDDDERSREIIARTLDFLKRRLGTEDRR